MAYGVGDVESDVCFVESCDVVDIAADPVGWLEDDGPAEAIVVWERLGQKASLDLAGHFELLDRIFGEFSLDSGRRSRRLDYVVGGYYLLGFGHISSFRALFSR